jgi:hypothetical protein
MVDIKDFDVVEVFNPGPAFDLDDEDSLEPAPDSSFFDDFDDEVDLVMTQLGSLYICS